MKTFVKKHFVWASALLILVATMSFKMAEKSNKFSLEWYEVDGLGNIGSMTSAPSGSCVIDHPENFCKIQLDTDNPKPSTVAEANDLGYTRGLAGVED
ncbi:hypothetical protein [Emticicia sp. TH156]|uniref:hypothetical protein n=1 Tax=Emticicia sp. TH156 TaxID=2067454 RepID=UPI000C76751A|nr:hypothetical protein [Emticicia sp. TH156]PLK44964.1 hypothetical protein C0V77_06880 [Emticicia sp. TH156]